MLASAIINRARLMLADTVATYRWSDATLIIYVNDAVDALTGRRPDLLMEDFGTSAEAIKALADVVATTGAIDLPDSTTEAMAHYVAYRALEADSADTANVNNADRHYQSFLRAAHGL